MLLCRPKRINKWESQLYCTNTLQPHNPLECADKFKTFKHHTVNIWPLQVDNLCQNSPHSTPLSRLETTITEHNTQLKTHQQTRFVMPSVSICKTGIGKWNSCLFLTSTSQTNNHQYTTIATVCRYYLCTTVMSSHLAVLTYISNSGSWILLPSHNWSWGKE